MNYKNLKIINTKRKIFMILLVIFTLSMLFYTLAIPTGPTIVSNTTETVTPKSGLNLSTAGGSFTTLVLNITQQTSRWKAYVGNVTGKLVLQDISNYTIYDWTLSSVTGEIYATRSSSTPSWGNIKCANSTLINSEESALNIASTNADSINKTFNTSKHKSFLVGVVNITNSTCPAIFTYINSTKQAIAENSSFQEVLLTDNTNFIYSAILENAKLGFDLGHYDFQMIVAEDETKTTPTPYYFYVEIL